MKKKLPKIIIYTFLIVLAASTILPILYMLMVTFMTNEQYTANMFSLPKSFNLDNYIYVLNEFDFVKYTFNSTVISLSAVFLSLLVTSMAGFSIAKLNFSGKKLFILLLLTGMFMPGQVLMLPVYQTLIKLNLVNNYFGLIIFYVAISIPFTTFMIVANVKTIPNEIMESAKIDGANSWKIYFRIILPLLKPTLATVAILNFIGYWNELLYALIFLQNPEMRTVTVAVVSLVNKFSSNPPLLYAGLMLSALPVIVIYFVFQKQITKGISSGAVK